MKKLIIGFLGALALVGCGGGSGGGGNKGDTKARIAYVNASPDTGSLEFQLNGDTRATVPFGTASDFESVSPKDYDVSVRAPGADDTIWSEAHTFNRDTDSIVVSVGLRTPFADNSVPPVVENDKRLVLAFSGPNRTAPNGNVARLIVVHGFVRKAGFPTPAIDVQSPGDNPAVVVATNVGFGAFAAKDVDAGAQTLVVRQNGTQQEFVPSTTYTLGAGKIYIALVSGIEGGAGGQAPAIRLIELPSR